MKAILMATPEVEAKLAEYADTIRTLGKQTIGNIIEIGRRLNDAKALVGHGNWLSWLEREFGWTDKTAQNFMSLANAASKNENFSNLNVPVSGLYLLARPNVPQEVIEAVAKHSEQGDRLSLAQIKQLVEQGDERMDAKIKAVKAMLSGGQVAAAEAEIDDEDEPDEEYTEEEIAAAWEKAANTIHAAWLQIANKLRHYVTCAHANNERMDPFYRNEDRFPEAAREILTAAQELVDWITDVRGE